MMGPAISETSSTNEVKKADTSVQVERLAPCPAHRGWRSDRPAACAGIAALWKLVLGGGKAPFAHVACGTCVGRCSALRRVEEVPNKRHGIPRTLFHQPMPRTSDDHLSNIGRHVAHDHRLQRTKRLLSAHSQY